MINQDVIIGKLFGSTDSNKTNKILRQLIIFYADGIAYSFRLSDMQLTMLHISDDGSLFMFQDNKYVPVVTIDNQPIKVQHFPGGEYSAVYYRLDKVFRTVMSTMDTLGTKCQEDANFVYTSSGNIREDGDSNSRTVNYAICRVGKAIISPMETRAEVDHRSGFLAGKRPTRALCMEQVIVTVPGLRYAINVNLIYRTKVVIERNDYISDGDYLSTRIPADIPLVGLMRDAQRFIAKGGRNEFAKLTNKELFSYVNNVFVILMKGFIDRYCPEIIPHLVLNDPVKKTYFVDAPYRKVGAAHNMILIYRMFASPMDSLSKRIKVASKRWYQIECEKQLYRNCNIDSEE